MLSSFFGKTKPINYFVLSGFLLLVYLIRLYYSIQGDWSQIFLPLEVLAFGAILLAIFVMNEVVRTEKVTSFNSYAMLFFVLLTICFSETLSDKDAIFANLFLVVAIWRLLAIRSMRNVKHKIFDSTFLIGLASLFFDWSLIYLILVLLVVNLYEGKVFKNWLVPLVALATLSIVVFTILLLNGNEAFFLEHYTFSLDLFFKTSLTELFGVKGVVYLLLFVAIAIFVFARTRKAGGGKLVLLQVVFIAFALGVFLYLLEVGNTTAILVTFFPAAIFLANFLEGIKREKLKEAMLAISILIPFLLLFLELSG